MQTKARPLWCNEQRVRMKRQKSGLKMGQRIHRVVNPDCKRAFIIGRHRRGRGKAGEHNGEKPGNAWFLLLFSIAVTMSRRKFTSNYGPREFLPSLQAFLSFFHFSEKGSTMPSKCRGYGNVRFSPMDYSESC